MLFVIVLVFVSGQAFAQSGTSSALSGTVVDPTGAAVSGAVVQATEVNTHAMRTVRQTCGAISVLGAKPRHVSGSISSSGFAKVTSEPTPVSVGRNVALNFTLKVKSPQSQTVEVRAEQGLLTLDNPNTTTTLEAKTIKSLPNPGQDLTYLAQFAKGR